MKKNYFTLLLLLIGLIVNSTTMYAQQLPNPSFEDWSGEKFDGKDQPKVGMSAILARQDSILI